MTFPYAAPIKLVPISYSPKFTPFKPAFELKNCPIDEETEFNEDNCMLEKQMISEYEELSLSVHHLKLRMRKLDRKIVIAQRRGHSNSTNINNVKEHADLKSIVSQKISKLRMLEAKQVIKKFLRDSQTDEETFFQKTEMEEERDLHSHQPSMSLIIEDEESEDSVLNNSLLRESSIQSISINKETTDDDDVGVDDGDDDGEEDDTKISDIALLEMYDNLGIEYQHEDYNFEDDDDIETGSVKYNNSSECSGSSAIGSNAGSVQINDDEDSNGNGENAMDDPLENGENVMETAIGNEKNAMENEKIVMENSKKVEMDDALVDETNLDLYDFGNGEINNSTPTSSSPSSSSNNNWSNTIRSSKDFNSILPPLSMLSISLIGSQSTSNESYHDYAEEEKSLQPTETHGEFMANEECDEQVSNGVSYGRSTRQERRAIMLEMRKKRQQNEVKEEDIGGNLRENRRKRRNKNEQNMNALKNKYQHQRRLREQNLHEISLNDLLAASSVEQEIEEENGEHLTLIEENILSSPMSSSLDSLSASSITVQPALSPNPQISDDETEQTFPLKRNKSSSPKRKIDYLDLNDPIINLYHPPVRHSLLLDLTNMSSLACVVEEDMDDEEGEGRFQVIEYVRDSDYDSDGSVVINKEVYHEVTVGGLMMDYSNNEEEDEDGMECNGRTSVL